MLNKPSIQILITFFLIIVEERSNPTADRTEDLHGAMEACKQMEAGGIFVNQCG
jgi:hypothetical protein